jgi:hypothetical protein
MNAPQTLQRPLLAVLACLAVTAQCAELPLYPKKGVVLQQLSAFDHPEGTIFSADGRYVFVSNSAELGMPDKGFHWVRGGGYVSRLAVQPDGTLRMSSRRLIAGLTGPLGMAVNPVATRRFPAGTIFLIESWSQPAESDGRAITDAAVIDPRIIAFSPGGKILGAIRLGANSVAQKVSGVIALLGNALAFDRSGNLYLADTDAGAAQFLPPLPSRGGGIYLFPHDSLDALAAGKSAPPMHYLPVPDGGPDGIEAGPDGLIHFNTVGLAAGHQDPAAGGMYRVAMADIVAGRLPAPFRHGLGALDGLDFAGNVRLDTEVKDTNSVVVTPLSDDKSYRLGFDRELQFNGPADIAIRKQTDGSFLLIVPELTALKPSNARNVVSVVRLPAGF